VAGNTSACSSTSVTYQEDSSITAAPTPTGTNPASPANNNSPTIFGSAPAGSTVRLYTDAACTAGPIGTGTAATFTSPGITVGVADNSTTTFHATATSASNNTSPCSSSSVTYVEDSIVPATPFGLDLSPPETTIIKGPKKKTRKRKPSFTFASSELGSRFQCQLDSGPFQPCASPFRPPAKLKFRKHAFRVQAIDPASNVDGTPAVLKFKVIPGR
jgi:hypothetical protein